MAENNQEELDLFYLTGKIQKAFNRMIVLGFEALRFIRKTWIIAVILIAAGIGYGLYVDSTTSAPKQARVLIRVNFDAVNYVYGIVESLNGKFPERDAVFSEDKNIQKELSKISSIQMEPVIDVKDILDRYSEDDRRLENFLRNVEFVFEEEGEFSAISETFRSEYYYHYLDISAAPHATEATIDALLEYINSTPLIVELKTSAMESMAVRIDQTQKSIDQIDDIMKKYKLQSESGSPEDSQLYVVENFDISRIFVTKIDLVRNLDQLKKEYVYAKDVVINVNNPALHDKVGFFKNSAVKYVVLFLGIFFFLAFVRYIYLGMRRIALSEAENS